MGVDLLAFGPHPDDIEIGVGGTVAKQVRLGHQVGLCDLTRGELGSDGTVDDRLAEASAGAAALGVAWRENLQWPDGEIGGGPNRSGARSSSCAAVAPRPCSFPTGRTAIPTTQRPATS